MTLSYVTRTYHVDLAALIKGLGLASDTDPNTDATLRRNAIQNFAL